MCFNHSSVGSEKALWLRSCTKIDYLSGKIINNRRHDLDFHCLNPQPEQEKGLNFIKCLKTSKTTELLDKLVEGKDFENWRTWEFIIQIRGGGCVKLNSLHVAIIMQSAPVSIHMLNQGNPADIAMAKVQRFVQNDFAQDDCKDDDDWIYGATVMHLAARFKHQCLTKLNEVDNEHLGNFLINNQDNEMKFTPLHVTAFAELHIGTR